MLGSIASAGVWPLRPGVEIFCDQIWSCAGLWIRSDRLKLVAAGLSSSYRQFRARHGFNGSGTLAPAALAAPGRDWHGGRSARRQRWHQPPALAARLGRRHRDVRLRAAGYVGHLVADHHDVGTTMFVIDAVVGLPCCGLVWVRRRHPLAVGWIAVGCSSDFPGGCRGRDRRVVHRGGALPAAANPAARRALCLRGRDLRRDLRPHAEPFQLRHALSSGWS